MDFHRVAPQDLFSDAAYIWVADIDSERNAFVSFEMEVPASEANPVWLHLFADTRYRLFVNDHFVAYGPARFVTGYPYFDSHDLTDRLSEAKNIVRVEVNFYGDSSFQTMPDGRPAFIAAGGDGEHVDFRTPGRWRARVHRAWRSDAPLFSFAQNPAEILDTRLLAEELTGPARVEPMACPSERSLRRDPLPRPVPYLPYTPMRPARLQLAAPLRRRFQRAGWLTLCPDAHSPGDGQSSAHPVQGFATWLHSEREQEIDFESYWCELRLNGAPVARESGGSPAGTRGISRLRLREGWNLLAGHFTLLRDHWSFLCGIPADAGVRWHARPDSAETAVFALGPVENAPPELPEPDSETFRLPPGWTLDSGDPSRVAPARVAAWGDVDEERAVRDLPFSDLADHGEIDAEEATWVFDFNDQFYGHPFLEVEAPAGTLLDVSFDDWKAKDGQAAIYESNPFTDATDRYVLRGGRQRIEAVNPRGGIYLQVTLRRPCDAGDGPLRLHDLHVHSRRTLERGEADFRCGAEIFDWAWDRSVHTLVAATDESYSDCPWRERGAYIGDCLVNIHLHRLIAIDMPVARRALDIFGEAQREDGLLPGVAPAWLTRSLIDYALLWVVSMRDYWELTGDVSLLETQWSRVEDLFASPMWVPGERGLWDLDERHAQFLDWGAIKEECTGPANAAINLIRVAALEAAAQCLEAMDRGAEASEWRDRAAAVREALVEVLWLPAEGRFAAGRNLDTPALHANILALRFGVGDAASLLRYLRPLLEENLQRGLESAGRSGVAELYFLFFLFPALARHGEHSLIEKLIEQHYGFLKNLGFPTLNECFHHAAKRTGSCCHSWSGAAALYLTGHTLGLRQETPGNPHRWILDPAEGSREEVQGAIPAGRGMLRVQWKREGGRIHASATVPEGARLVTRREDIQLTIIPA